MITGRDCRQEFSKAKEAVKTEEGKALLKTNEVNNKLLLNIRLILDKIREYLKVPKIETKRIISVAKTGTDSGIVLDNCTDSSKVGIEIGNDKILDVKTENKSKIDIINK